MSPEFDLNSSNKVPIYQQIHDQIREKILSGEIEPGSKLPSSRILARELAVARVSITSAYNQLAAEGYVLRKVGAGTYVNPGLLIRNRLPDSSTMPKTMLSEWGQRVSSLGPVHPSVEPLSRTPIDFGFGRSFPHIFPYETWRKLLARYLSTDDAMLSRYGSAAGFNPLREAVASYLQRMRGVNCTMDQVVIVSGMQQALDILSRLLLDDGDQILVENPGYMDAYKLFGTFGAELIPISVDDQGFPVELIPAGCHPRFAFVTPSNQFPKGGTMPLARRLALLDWAGENDTLILEDDYDGELRYGCHPIASLQGLDLQERVIYLGTFSKVLFPALRLGYLVLPRSLLSPFLVAKELVDRGAPTLTQAAVADFITEGYFDRHLKRLRKVYGRRRQTLTEALELSLPSLVDYSHVEAGLHIMIYLMADIKEGELIQEAAREGISIYPGSPYHLGQPHRPSIMLSFSGLSRGEIVEGVRRLATVIRRLIDA